MKYLITGASGFLGGRLSTFLENKGFEIIRGSSNLKIIESSNYTNWVLTEFNNFETLKKYVRASIILFMQQVQMQIIVNKILNLHLISIV